ncbi:hypothetical protein AB7C87_23090 [Natrarchaeobius sp. A-rgal3]|uniref:DUF7504 family protein n=1 Tax=Natrarchaeobius versutus TaxID=1679078 RepID=UPI00350F2AFD
MDPISPDAVDPPANVLFVDDESHGPRACHELCRGGANSAFLAVSVDGPRAERPSPEGIGGPIESLAVGEGAERKPAGDREAVNTGPISDPGDLSAIGTAVLRTCSKWSESGREISICFDSVDELLEHTSPSGVYQFTHALANRLSNADVCAHFHLDPSSHEAEVVSNLEEIFDETVTVDRPREEGDEAGTNDESQTSDSQTETVTDDDSLSRAVERRSGSEATTLEPSPETGGREFVEATDAAVAAAFGDERDDDERDDVGSTSSGEESDRELPEATDAAVAAAFDDQRNGSETAE